MNMQRDWDSWQLAQVHSLHSDGLIPVRATATQCPSGDLKIVTQAKNSGELCSLKAALTWAHSTKLCCHTLWSFPQTGQCIETVKMTRLYIYNMSCSIMTLFLPSSTLLPQIEKHQKFPWAPLACVWVTCLVHRSLQLIVKTTLQHLSFWWLLAFVLKKWPPCCQPSAVTIAFSSLSPSFHTQLSSLLLPLYHPISAASSQVCILQTAVKCPPCPGIVATVVSRNLCCFLGSTNLRYTIGILGWGSSFHPAFLTLCR